MNLAIDLGGTRIRLALGDGAGPFRREHHQRRPDGMTPPAFLALVESVLAAWGLRPADLGGIGISAAAVVDRDGRVVRAENIGWSDVPLRALIAEAFGRPAAVDTDVFCGALYEARLGQARTSRSALYVAVGTGIGHALILDGRVWRGASGAANAIGHMVVRPGGRRCYCGNAGCLCAFASGLANEAGGDGDRALQALAQALGAAATLIEPERIILTGGALNQAWFDLARLEALLPRLSYPGLARPDLVHSSVADPNLRGAALLLKETA
ncbi:ROK family protein [Labrys wisconsinensis]|uniref:Glucokinase n=1 Tax=Labrys wisconsinensis TaxID=425677 RepID=A0ABU0JK00_9HYPH|nr:ROK family protein [Labrys wisconsinensis]MDQ0474612.1 glucokinase [Labrys wisconsinensis]